MHTVLFACAHACVLCTVLTLLSLSLKVLWGQSSICTSQRGLAMESQSHLMTSIIAFREQVRKTGLLESIEGPCIIHYMHVSYSICMFWMCRCRVQCMCNACMLVYTCMHCMSITLLICIICAPIYICIYTYIMCYMQSDRLDSITSHAPPLFMYTHREWTSICIGLCLYSAHEKLINVSTCLLRLYILLQVQQATYTLSNACMHEWKVTTIYIYIYVYI